MILEHSFFNLTKYFILILPENNNDLLYQRLQMHMRIAHTIQIIPIKIQHSSQGIVRFYLLFCPESTIFNESFSS